MKFHLYDPELSKQITKTGQEQLTKLLRNLQMGDFSVEVLENGDFNIWSDREATIVVCQPIKLENLTNPCKEVTIDTVVEVLNYETQQWEEQESTGYQDIFDDLRAILPSSWKLSVARDTSHENGEVVVLSDDDLDAVQWAIEQNKK